MATPDGCRVAGEGVGRAEEAGPPEGGEEEAVPVPWLLELKHPRPDAGGSILERGQPSQCLPGSSSKTDKLDKHFVFWSDVFPLFCKTNIHFTYFAKC